MIACAAGKPFPSPEGASCPARRTRHFPPRTALARERIPTAREALADCHLCLHHCGVNRIAGPAGLCHAGPEARFFCAQTDVSDELELLPSFAISLSGCNLRCDFCITGDASWNPRAGTPLSGSDLTEVAHSALAHGAKTIMILGGEPTIHLPALLELVACLPDDAPIVLKTNACFTSTVRPFLAGLFDVWLPDLKFGNPQCARRLAGIPLAPTQSGRTTAGPSPLSTPFATSNSDYWSTVTANLHWMAAQHDRSDTIVRHLLMPGHIDCCWEPIAHWLSTQLPEVQVSLRSGFWPAWHSGRHPELRTPLHPTDLEQARVIARDCHLHLIP